MSIRQMNKVKLTILSVLISFLIGCASTLQYKNMIPNIKITNKLI